MTIYLSDLLAATSGSLLSAVSPREDVAFTGFCFDSRRAKPGELFVALKTERGDGHDFIADAFARGATGALVNDENFAVSRRSSIVAVPDTYDALTKYARYIIRKRGLPIIGITGSVGKTTTRAAVAAVLSQHFKVFQNPANFNGRLGVPIALGALEPEHEMIVLEMAADRLGEIRELCEIAPPHIGIVTNVSEAHLAFFGSLEETAREKRALIEALPSDGLAILNRDDPRVWDMRRYTKARVIGAREGESGAPSLDFSGPRSGGERGSITPSPFHPFTLSHAMAREVGKHYDIPDDDVEDALANLPSLPGRMNVLQGVNGTTLIDDSFSANPASIRAAVVGATDSVTPTTHIFLVLGDMDQLGDHSSRLHREIGQLIAQRARYVNITLITLGEEAQHIVAGACDAGLDARQVVPTYLARDAIDYVKSHAQSGDVVLVKGDVSARMERVAAALLADPNDKHKLARQEPGWESVQVAKPARPTWLDVDLDAIAHNVRAIKRLIGNDVSLMVVLKADGYGHGAIKVARTALNNGADYCGVASLNEAIALRAARIDAPILILGFTPAWHAKEALLRDVVMTVYDLDVARAYSRAASELHRTARVHVKVDTGMSRLGVLPHQAAAFVRDVAALPNVEIEGIFTHFSCADSDDAYTRLQLQRFNDVLSSVIHPSSSASSVIRHIHAANSAATLAYPEARFNMVRMGLAMYGLNPRSRTPAPPHPPTLPLKPALSWKTTVSQVKTLPPGTPVSYGNTYLCARETKVAIIPVGYADGFRRAPDNFGEVLVRGQRAPLIGRVCMDQSVVDVTHIPGVRLGDEVVLIGQQGDQQITVEEVAARLGTISYEVVSAILPRVPRVS